MTPQSEGEMISFCDVAISLLIDQLSSDLVGMFAISLLFDCFSPNIVDATISV